MKKICGVVSAVALAIGYLVVKQQDVRYRKESEAWAAANEQTYRLKP
ncbi:MAG: hypothetical protein ACRDAX_04230 [Propionibacteriaceae bacterium]